MSLDLQQERLQAHALLDQLPLAKLGAVRSLLEVMIEREYEAEEEEPVTEEDIRRFRDSEAFFASGKGIPMEELLAEFGLKPEDFPLSK